MCYILQLKIKSNVSSSEINTYLHGKQIQQVNYQNSNIIGLIKIHDNIEIFLSGHKDIILMEVTGPQPQLTYTETLLRRDCFTLLAGCSSFWLARWSFTIYGSLFNPSHFTCPLIVKRPPCPVMPHVKKYWHNDNTHIIQIHSHWASACPI